MRLLSIAVLATLPIAFGAPIQLAKTTEVANAKRSESVAAIVKALVDSNRLIARDGGSQYDVMKRGVPTGGTIGGIGEGALSAGEIESLLEFLSLSKGGAINKRQLGSLLGGLLDPLGLGLGSGGLGDVGGGLGGGAQATPSSPVNPVPASPPSSGTYGNAPSSGGDPSPGNSGSSPPGNGGTGGSWPSSSGGASDGGSGDPGNGWPGTGEPGSGGAGSSGSPGGYTSTQPPAYGGSK